MVEENIVGMEQPDLLGKVVSQEMVSRRQVNKRLEGYQDNIKFCQPHSYLEVNTPEFVKLQAHHLKSDLIPAEEMLQPNNSSQPCIFCMEHASTRMIVPCGHWMRCINCTNQWVMDKHCHQETSADGNIISHNNYPLPIQCPPMHWLGTY
ncbi:hypothetical protein LSTR_LSTR005246 [Laodelphax striatellus]|uniref:RING-type domain-containing protein n=1 Tax=Laodelphax striatellus TaxID=195883 RepID=A0A482X7M1_LAOST|nr:hypothetical protein LSTR_LSTR005246 [Laodelphax striatellus]